jgi:hypothetical protein
MAVSFLKIMLYSVGAIRTISSWMSDEASWTTGAIHDVDGGVMAGR